VYSGTPDGLSFKNRFGRSIEGDGALGSLDTNICEAHGVPFIAGLLLSVRFFVAFLGDDVDPTGVLWLRRDNMHHRLQ
jgi:hypothetical protein